MARKSVQTIVCPSCGAKVKFETYDVINGTLQPELREGLLSGDLLVAHCDKCGYEGLVEYSLLYIDVENHFVVDLASDEEAEVLDTLFCELSGGDASGELISSLPEPLASAGSLADYRFRIVSSYADLVDKVVAFELGLDDRAVELLKIDLLRDENDEVPDDCDQPVILLGEDDEDGIVFEFAPEQDDESFIASVDRACYEDLVRVVEALDEEGVDCGFVIDRAWALATTLELEG